MTMTGGYKRNPSILQTDRKCAVCGCTRELEAHEPIHGTANRKLSCADGLWLWLCREHHHQVHNGNIALDCELKQVSQAKWMQVNGKTSEAFIKRYGKSYL